MDRETDPTPTPDSEQLYNAIFSALVTTELQLDGDGSFSRTRNLSDKEVTNANKVLGFYGLESADDISLFYQDTPPHIDATFRDIPGVLSTSLQLQRGPLVTHYIFDIHEDRSILETRSVVIDRAALYESFDNFGGFDSLRPTVRDRLEFDTKIEKIHTEENQFMTDVLKETHRIITDYAEALKAAETEVKTELDLRNSEDKTIQLEEKLAIRQITLGLHL